MVSCLVHTEMKSLFSFSCPPAKSTPLIFAKTPFASPPGALRSSEPFFSSGVLESDCLLTEDDSEVSVVSGGANRTVTAFRAFSPSPEINTAARSTGGTTIHCPALGAVTETTCPVVPGTVPSRVMCCLIGGGVVPSGSDDASASDGASSDEASDDASLPKGPSSASPVALDELASTGFAVSNLDASAFVTIVRRPSTRTRIEPVRSPTTSVATRTGSPLVPGGIVSPDCLPGGGVSPLPKEIPKEELASPNSLASISFVVSARTRSCTRSPFANCRGALTVSPFTSNTTQGKCSLANRLSPSRNTRCATACGEPPRSTGTEGVSAHWPGGRK
mmetsp:Transcript_12150/g.45188  ORF Transcript_12150/g.45188 Transcript_12150/m.45188 type:complete len:333 (-) Transcript_12150:1800-2798(-)